MTHIALEAGTHIGPARYTAQEVLQHMCWGLEHRLTLTHNSWVCTQLIGKATSFMKSTSKSILTAWHLHM